MTSFRRVRLQGNKPLDAAALQRAVAKAEKERDLQSELSEVLNLGLPADAVFTSIPGGDGRATRTPGYLSGFPDALIMYRKRCLLLELKRRVGGRYSDDQIRVHAQIERAGGLVFGVNTLDQALDLIRDELQCPIRLRLS